MCTLTVSLVGMQFPNFWFVAGRGCESTCKATRAPWSPRPKPIGPGKVARAPRHPRPRLIGPGKAARAPQPPGPRGHDQLDLAKLPEHHDLLGNGDLDLAKPPQHRGLSLGHEEHQEQDYLCPHHTKS
ncbi:hypothetical protein Tco_0289629 [Tanacetum coccineum]